MVTFTEILLEDLEPFVRFAFYGDHDLIQKYHIVNGDFERCVADTMKRIRETSKNDDMRYYSVWHGWIPVGFTVMGESFLFSFGIRMESRTKEVVGSWWQQVCRMLDHEFVTWIFKKNTRAVEFLRQNGMEVVDDDPEKDFYNLIYILCPQEV